MSIIDIAITFFIYIEKNKFRDELDIIIMAPDVGFVFNYFALLLPYFY